MRFSCLTMIALSLRNSSSNFVLSSANCCSETPPTIATCCCCAPLLAGDMLPPPPPPAPVVPLLTVTGDPLAEAADAPPFGPILSRTFDFFVTVSVVLWACDT
uniref:Putative secreted protein n=1 Tax=Anopheles darlingi TaxID=43151 RepID=A0A2M4DEC5_ANODA